MGKGTRRYAVTPRTRAASFIVAHVFVLGSLLTYLRLGKLRLQAADVSVLNQLLTIASDWGLLLLLQVPWLLTIRGRWAERFTSWAICYFMFHVPIYVIGVIGHRYFLETGVTQTFEMIVYMLTNFSTAKGVLAAGLDSTFYTLVVIVALCWTGVAVVARLRFSLPRLDHIIVPALAVTLGAALVFAPAPRLTAAKLLAGNFITDLLPVPERAQYLQRSVPLWVPYAFPQVRGSIEEAGQEQKKPPPDVLLVLLESTRRDLFAAYGADPSILPNFNRLLKDAAVFDDVYVGLSHTTKELVTIHCGMYPMLVMELVEAQAGGVRMNCLPRMLKSLGYSSAFFQTAINFEARKQLLANLGYDRFFVADRTVANDAKRRGYLGWEESLMLPFLETWLNEPISPKFTTLLTLGTHHPYLFDRSVPRDWKRVKKSYLHAAKTVDESLGKYLLDAQNSGRLDNTILVVTGDHGEAFGERPGFLQHDMVPYEEVTRVPLFIMGPGISESGHQAGLRHHIDIVPTLLRVLDAQVEGVLPGRDLVLSSGHNFVVSSCWYQAHCMSLRHGDLAFAFFFGRIPMEIYDLSVDPMQLHDISHQVSQETKETAINFMLGARASSIEAYVRGGWNR